MAYGFESYDSNGYLIYSTTSSVVTIRAPQYFSVTLAGGEYQNLTVSGATSSAIWQANFYASVWPDNYQYPATISYITTNTIRITDTRASSETEDRQYYISIFYWNL